MLFKDTNNFLVSSKLAIYIFLIDSISDANNPVDDKLLMASSMSIISLLNILISLSYISISCKVSTINISFSALVFSLGYFGFTFTYILCILTFGSYGADVDVDDECFDNV